MKSKFNPKIFRNKRRVYQSIVGASNILRLYVWDEDHKEYLHPEFGYCYEARRWELTNSGQSVRIKKSFGRFEDAKAWQRTGSIFEAPPQTVDSLLLGAKRVVYFFELLSLWKDNHFPTIQPGTQRQYEKLLDLHFSSLRDVPVTRITPAVVDDWLAGLKDSDSPAMRSKTRKSFDHELTLLATILRFCVEYDDESKFRYPIKDRHRKSALLNRKLKPRLKKITEQEFLSFVSELESDKLASILVPMATTQYYEALRISEAAALHWEDIVFNSTAPRDSYIRVSRKVDWPRRKNTPSFITDGFKNSEVNNGAKELPMFPRVFEALLNLQRGKSKGLVFQVDDRHLEYHTIKNAFDRAFKRAGLPHRATHIMRHGGCQRQYDKNGDFDVAKQILGNTGDQSVRVYAQRSTSALKEVNHQEWDNHLKLVATGRKLEIVK